MRGVLLLCAALAGVALWLWMSAGQPTADAPRIPQAAVTPIDTARTPGNPTPHRAAGPGAAAATHDRVAPAQPTHARTPPGVVRVPIHEQTADAQGVPPTMQARNNPVPAVVEPPSLVDNGGDDDWPDTTFDGERPSRRSLEDTGGGLALDAVHARQDVTFDGVRPEDDVTFDGVRPPRILSPTERGDVAPTPPPDVTNSPEANQAPEVTPFDPNETRAAPMSVPTWQGPGTVVTDP